MDNLSHLPPQIKRINFWNEGRVGGYADIMVAPEDIAGVKDSLMKKQFDFSSMIDNVQDLISLEKVVIYHFF